MNAQPWKSGALEQLGLGVKHGEDACHRVGWVDRVDRGPQPSEDAHLPLLEVGPDEFLLATEGAVERRLGDAGPLDHAVDSDRLHSLGVEQLARRLEQSLAWRATHGVGSGARSRGHLSLLGS